MDGGSLLCLVLIVLGIGAFIWMWVEDQKCPSCGASFSKVEVNKEAISRNKGYKTVRRERKNSAGEVISSWDEQIRVLKVKYRHDYRCPSCRHEWSTISESEYDNFND